MRISKLCLVVCAVTLCAAIPDCPRRRQSRPSRRPRGAGGKDARIGHATGADECAGARPRDAGPTSPAAPCQRAAAGDKSAGDGNQSSSRARGNDANNERNECTAGPAAGGSHAVRGNRAASPPTRRRQPRRR